MEFDWRDEKNELNKRNHNLSFEDALHVFGDLLCVTVSSYRPRDREHRYKTIGRLGEKLYVVVWTWRDPFHWIISARRTDRREDRIYAQANAEDDA